MKRYAAFLRSVNVGGHTVKMDFLRRLFESMEFLNVETFIASGNVIFESAVTDAHNLEKKIEDKLTETLGYKVATFIRSITELAEIADYRPFKESELEASLYIAFVSGPLKDEVERKLMSFETETDNFRVRNREIYWLCRTKFSESSFSGALLEKVLGAPATIRNANTVRKMAAKYCGAGS
jgi:uncharacterized protein (DUF1697 family)